MTEKRRPLFWEGSSTKDFKEFPIPVQKDMGVALFVVQLGRTPESAKPWKGLGSGVYELVEDHRGDTFRAVYTVRVGDAIFAKVPARTDVGGPEVAGGQVLIGNVVMRQHRVTFDFKHGLLWLER